MTVLAVQWHRHIPKRQVDARRVSSPLWGISARGELVKCSCGKRWAR